jgi:hypothetical protein
MELFYRDVDVEKARARERVDPELGLATSIVGMEIDLDKDIAASQLAQEGGPQGVSRCSRSP